MGWYGRSGLALVAGGVFAGIGYAVANWRQSHRYAEFRRSAIRGHTFAIFAILLILGAAIVYEQISWFPRPARQLEPATSHPQHAPAESGW